MAWTLIRHVRIYNGRAMGTHAFRMKRHNKRSLQPDERNRPAIFRTVVLHFRLGFRHVSLIVRIALHHKREDGVVLNEESLRLGFN